MYRALEDLHLNTESYNAILNEYKKSLKELINVTEKFIECHKDFNNVLTDCKLKKQEKIDRMVGYSPLQKYISRNQLESILYKLFLRKVSLGMNISNHHDWNIGEPHGTAILQIDLCRFFVKSGRSTNLEYNIREMQ